jgi:hypothetical protein
MKLLIISGVLLVSALGAIAKADIIADTTISVYDKPADHTKMVIEICVKNKCQSLTTTQKEYEQNYKKIEDWVNKVVDNPEALK